MKKEKEWKKEVMQRMAIRMEEEKKRRRRGEEEEKKREALLWKPGHLAKNLEVQKEREQKVERGGEEGGTAERTGWDSNRSWRGRGEGRRRGRRRKQINLEREESRMERR